MFELLTFIEGTYLGSTLRNSGVWTYGVINLAHILGVSSLFGAVLLLDLRMLGVWRQIPLVSVTRPAVPIAGIGLAVAVTSGVLMLSFNASEYYGNPFFYAKFPLILLGVINVGVLSFMPAWREKKSRELTMREERQLAIFGGVSLAIWLSVVSTGRMIGYW